MIFRMNAGELDWHFQGSGLEKFSVQPTHSVVGIKHAHDSHRLSEMPRTLLLHNAPLVAGCQILQVARATLLWWSHAHSQAVLPSHNSHSKAAVHRYPNLMGSFLHAITCAIADRYRATRCQTIGVVSISMPPPQQTGLQLTWRTRLSAFRPGLPDRPSGKPQSSKWLAMSTLDTKGVGPA